MEFIKHNISAKGELHYCAEQLKIHGKYTSQGVLQNVYIVVCTFVWNIKIIYYDVYIYINPLREKKLHITTSAILRINKCLFIICSRQTIA